MGREFIYFQIEYTLMEILGFPLQFFIFYIFLPFIFFFLLIYSLLRKSKILGEGAQRIELVLALVISALSIFSLNSLTLSYLLPFLAAFLATIAFLLLFFIGLGGYVVKKTTDYISGEAFKTDEERFEEKSKECEALVLTVKEKKTLDEVKRTIKELDKKVEELKKLAEKIGKKVEDLRWYKEYVKIKKQIGE